MVPAEAVPAEAVPAEAVPAEAVPGQVQAGLLPAAAAPVAGSVLPPAGSGVPTTNAWVPDGASAAGPAHDGSALRAVITDHRPEDLPDLLRRSDGIVWVDVPSWDDDAAAMLTYAFGFHPLAIRDCSQRNQVPKVHKYADHLFLVLHAPFAGRSGHVHYIELDQFVGRNYLVTVHGPLNPAVDPQVATVEVQSLLNRLTSGRLRPTEPFELSHALVSALTGRLRNYTAELTRDVWQLEQRVTAGHLGDPEEFLEEMFRARHGLLTVETMASLSREVYARMAKIQAFGAGRGADLLDDSVDQFDRLRAMSHGQKEYLVGTIEFYQARTNTKMTIAAERLAVIAAVTLPITALSSILGMNLIVNEQTHYGQLAVALTTMLIMSVLLLIWAKRKGWW
jgi:Mg2+ and Co2+ transporter CorA